MKIEWPDNSFEPDGVADKSSRQPGDQSARNTSRPYLSTRYRNHAEGKDGFPVDECVRVRFIFSKISLHISSLERFIPWNHNFSSRNFVSIIFNIFSLDFFNFIVK